MSIRPAATVVVAREPQVTGAGPGVEVLVLRRSRRSRFAPGFVVFPGGVVEPQDEELAAGWFGTPAEAARACALRELAEETGLVLTAGGLVEAPGELPGDPGLAAPPADLVRDMARWVAPDFLPVRFDARLFALVAPPNLTPRPDGLEIEHAWWSTPAAVLERHDGIDVGLMWPTLKTLEALTSCHSVDDVLNLRVEQVGPPGAPR